MTSEPTDDSFAAPAIAAGALARDVAAGLGQSPRELPPKYFYDSVGSMLFERICELPEYYQTRAERSIISRLSSELVRRTGTGTIVELGAGSASKTRLLFEAAHDAGLPVTYVPVDISESMLRQTASALRTEYPWISVAPVTGDFAADPHLTRADEPRLILLLGGTIGNLDVDAAPLLLGRVAVSMNSDDRFVLGVDLVKDPRLLHAAYNDAEGVTAEFNLNVLRVINRELGAEFRLDTFAHYAFYMPELEQIEMHLASLVNQAVPVRSLGTVYSFQRGETIRTEISRKFTLASASRMLLRSGMELEEMYVDERNLFGLCVARRAQGGAL